MRAINTKTRTLDFTGLTKSCISCDGTGNNRTFWKRCTACDGAGKVLKPGNKMRTKCTHCNGKGGFHLDEPIILGVCGVCEGTGFVPMTRFDTMLPQDRQWIFQNLFNFEKPYDDTYSEFNEGYLGFGVVISITDYGRYLEMTPDEFKAEVWKHFENGYNQYVCLSTKEGVLCKEILIRKGSNGWAAYPIF